VELGQAFAKTRSCLAGIDAKTQNLSHALNPALEIKNQDRDDGSIAHLLKSLTKMSQYTL
jgi:hypothetical protein